MSLVRLAVGDRNGDKPSLPWTAFPRTRRTW